MLGMTVGAAPVAADSPPVLQVDGDEGPDGGDIPVDVDDSDSDDDEDEGEDEEDSPSGDEEVGSADEDSVGVGMDDDGVGVGVGDGDGDGVGAGVDESSGASDAGASEDGVGADGAGDDEGELTDEQRDDLPDWVDEDDIDEDTLEEINESEGEGASADGGVDQLGGGGGPGGDGMDGFGDAFIEGQMSDIVQWFMSAAAEESVAAVGTLMEELNELLYTLPAPGEPTDPISWYTPENGWWPDVMGLYWMFGSIAMGLLFLAGGASFIVDDPGMSKGYLRLSVIGMFAVLAGPLFIGAYLHFLNELSLAIAPSGEEFLEGPDNMLQLATGSVLFFILLKVKVAVLIVGVAVLLGQFFLTFILVALWPFSWASRSVPMGAINAFGSLIFNSFILLGLLKIGQSSSARIVFELDWGAYHWMGGLLVLVATILILLFALVALPWFFIKKLLTAAGVSLGMADISDRSEQAKSVTVEKTGQAKQRWDESYRGRVSRGVRAAVPSTLQRNRSSSNASSGTSNSSTGSTSASTTQSKTPSSATGRMPSPGLSKSSGTANTRRRRNDIDRSTRSDD